MHLFHTVHSDCSVVGNVIKHSDLVVQLYLYISTGCKEHLQSPALDIYDFSVKVTIDP